MNPTQKVLKKLEKFIKVKNKKMVLTVKRHMYETNYQIGKLLYFIPDFMKLVVGVRINDADIEGEYKIVKQSRDRFIDISEYLRNNPHFKEGRITIYIDQEGGKL